jgi:hypothetical protein
MPLNEDVIQSNKKMNTIAGCWGFSFCVYCRAFCRKDGAIVAKHPGAFSKHYIKHSNREVFKTFKIVLGRAFFLASVSTIILLLSVLVWSTHSGFH